MRESKGIKWNKDITLKCGTCKKQTFMRICKKHGVKAPDKQQACVDYKVR